MFSKACQYGIRATLYIAESSIENQRVSLKDIAKGIDSPEAFTAKILQQLARKGIIHSVKGPSGGFEIQPEDFEKIKLIQIVSAIDGDHFFTGCGLGLKKCDENNPCPIHNEFKSVREGMKTMLSNTDIRTLANGIKSGNTFLKI